MYCIDDENDEIYCDDCSSDYEQVEYRLKVIFKTNLGRQDEIVVNHSFEINGYGWYEDLTGEGSHAYCWEADSDSVEGYVEDLKGVVNNDERELLKETVYDNSDFDFQENEEIVEFLKVEFA